MASSTLSSVEVVREERQPGAVPLYRHPGWAERFPWLLQGTTARGEVSPPFDLRLSGTLPVHEVLGRWRLLREALGFPAAVHAYQVHGARVLYHEAAAAAALLLADDADGHATRAPGVLLTVSVADCIPISLVDPERRAVALLHGGWRGVAAGIVERGIALLAERAGSRAESLYLHFGPAICGRCYEVGAEVHEALGLARPSAPTPIDLRALAAERALACGVPAAQVSLSAFCTRCPGSPFFSHRAGCGERQVGVLGLTGGGGA
jgi:YfiH family protein